MLQTDRADKRCDALPVRIPHIGLRPGEPAILSRQIAAPGIWVFGAAPQCIHSEPQLQPSWAIR
jgi:hypothetical protein